MIFQVRRLYLIILIIFSSVLLAQENLKFFKLNVDHGLSQSSITSIIQDKRGFLWFGTMSGLNRYDGYSFKTYYFNPRDTNSLSESWINSIVEDKSGLLWIGTRSGGLTLFNPSTEQFIRYTHNSSKSGTLSNNVVNCLLFDNIGTLWIGTEKGLNKFNAHTLSFEGYFSDEKNTSGLSNNYVNCMFSDSENNLWIGTNNGGLNKFNKSGNDFSNYHYSTKTTEGVYAISELNKTTLVLATGEGLRFFDKRTGSFIDSEIASDTLKTIRITSVFKESENTFWFGVQFNVSKSGLIKLNTKTGKETNYFPDENNPDAISNEKILTTFKDKSGVMWVGTYGKGLNYFNPGASKFFHLKKGNLQSPGLNSEYVYSIMEDRDGSVWIGTSDQGINHYFPLTGKIELETVDPSLVRVTAIAEGNNGQLWIGSNSRTNPKFLLFDKRSKKTTNFLAKPNDENFINDLHVKCILVDDKLVYVGTAYGGLNVLNTETNQFTHYTHDDKLLDYSIAADEVNDIYKAKDGRIWLATREGVDVFNPINQKFIHYTYNPKDSNSLSNNYALCITQDRNDNIWIGTSFGLNKFDVNSNRFNSYTIQNGLPDNYIYGILEDNKGSLWISTNNGLSKYSLLRNTFKNFSTTDGLQSKEFNTHAFHKGKSGNMYFGGINGLNSFNPDSVKTKTVIPDILITSFKIFGKEMLLDTAISHKKNIVLSYSQNFLSFEFASVDFLIPNKNEFACKMEGFDEDWIKLGYNHNVSYSNLDPGEYIFRVKGTNNDGVWNEEGTYIYITILPPFYKTKLFYGICIFTILFLGFIFYKIRVNALLKTQQLLEGQVIQRTKEIKEANDELESKNKDITDSINYARRIQNAILTSEHYIKKHIQNYFIFYRPKDIISGDFYWMYRTDDNKIYTVIADCTGHGVPGAFMSLIGASKLNEIIQEKKITNPALILNQLREDIINSLNPEGAEVESQDGMDLVICCFDFENMKLDFSCANNPLWIIRQGELIEFRPDKMPIGKHFGEVKPFTLQTSKLLPGDFVISFTDGFADQFGGENGKKYKYKKLQELLLSHQDKPLNDIKTILRQEFDTWKRGYEQVDDVLIMGIRV